MDDSIELATIKKCVSDLENALRGAESSLVHFLNREGFLTDSMSSKILQPTSVLTDEQKASELVKWIKHRVQQDPDSYHALVAELKSSKYGKYYLPILKLLEDEYASHQPPVPEVSQEQEQPPASPKSSLDTLHPDIRMDLDYKLTQNYKKLRGRYASFTFNLCECMKKKDITVIQLYNFLKVCDLSPESMAKIKRSTTVDDAFSVIHDDCATYFHYDVFESLKEEFCTSSDFEGNPKLNYSEHFKKYVNLHKISEFFAINPALNARYNRDSSTELIFKIENFRMDHKVSKLVDLRWEISAILGKSPSSLQLLKVEEGCLIVTFLIPAIMAEAMFSCDEVLSPKQVQEFQALSILWMKCGDRTVEIQPSVNETSDSEVNMEETLKIHYARIRDSFADLVMKVPAILEKRKTDMKAFRQHMLDMFPSGDIFKDLVTISEYFEAISTHKLWDCYNYHLIENIADKFGGDDTELKVWINDNKSEISRFKATTRIVDYVRVCQKFDQSNIARYDSQYYMKLEVTLKSSVEKESLDYIDHFWQSIADHFLLPPLSVLLEDIKEQCEEVTWLVPPLPALQIQYNIQDSTTFLKRSGIVQVIMDSEILYQEEHPDGQEEAYLNQEFLSACESGDMESVLALLACGVGVDTPKDTNGDTPLIKACSYGKIEVVKFLLDHGVNVHAQDEVGYTAMHWSCQEGHLDIVKIMLLSHRASLEDVTKRGATPLMLASRKGRIEVVKFLLEQGANVHAQDEGGFTAMHYSCGRGHLDIIKILQLLHGASLEAVMKHGITPLMMACYYGHTEVVQFLLEQGANVHAQSENGHTAMHHSCVWGHLDSIKILLSHGASLEAVVKDGITPLMLASYHGHIEVVKFLLENGANVHAQNEDGETAMHWSCARGHLDIVKILQLSHEASLEAVMKDGRTPLMIASGFGHIEVVKFLLEQGANVHAQSEGGDTAIHWSCQEGHLDIVKLLQYSGASLDVVAKDGYTPLIDACKGNSVNVVQYLLEQKPSLIHAQTESGWTALMVATKNGSLETMKLLLETNPGTIDCTEKSTGWTALFIAAKSGHLPILRMLIEYGADIYMKATDDVTAYDVAVINNQNEVCDELKRHGYQPVAPPTEQMKRGVEHSNKVLTQEFDSMDHMKQFELLFTTRERRESTRKRNYPSLGTYDDLEEQFRPHQLN